MKSGNTHEYEIQMENSLYLPNDFILQKLYHKE